MNSRVALVTGASRGIGKAILHKLGSMGFVAVGTATTNEGAGKIDSGLAQADLSGKGLVLDVTQADSVASLLDEIRDRYSAPYVLVNNAAITRDNLLLRMKDHEWDAVIDTNLSSAYRLTRACLRDMIKMRGGRVVNITSVTAFSGNAGQANYVAAKAGVVGFTKSLALEVASRGITVNAVAPGFIETDMTAKLGESQQAKLVEKIPLGRIGSTDEVAHVVSFLVSAEAGYITGETVHVNGGLYMA